MLNPRTTLFVAVLWAGAGALLPGSAQAAQLGLSWSDNSVDEDGFLVERREASAGAFTQIALLGPNVATYLDSTVAAGGSYCYRVGAFNSVGMSAYTNEACGTATASQTYPLSVSLNKSTFSRGETLVSTVNAVGGLINTPVDAYVVVDTGGAGSCPCNSMAVSCAGSFRSREGSCCRRCRRRSHSPWPAPRLAPTPGWQPSLLPER